MAHLAVNACLAPICSMHGLAVTTVEGIGSTKTKLHPVQERLAKAHGSQCGFCTPGIVMSMYALLRSLPGKPTMKDMEVALQGNLCRCTGYRPILEGFKTFTEEWERDRLTNGTNGINGSVQNGNGVCAMGENCCKNKKPGDEEEKEELFSPSEFTPYDKSQEPTFPPELQLNDTYDKEYLQIRGPRATWYRPQTLTQLLELKAKFPEAKLVVGNSEIGVEVKFKKFFYPVLIQPSLIPELTQPRVEENGVWIGGATSLNDMRAILSEQIEKLPSHKSRVYVAIVEMLHWFAGNQIRNVAAIGGNIMTGSPISDMNPILMAARCRLLLESKAEGTREVTMDGSFYTSYRKNIVRPDEVLRAIYIPHTAETQYFKAYKQARRRDDDIAIVNAAFNVTLDIQSDGAVVKDCEFAFGGMAPTTVLAKKTTEQMINKPWNQSLLEDTWRNLMADLPLDHSAPGGMIQYRRSLTLSLFYKFYIAVSVDTQVTPISSRDKSGAQTFHTLPTKSSQYFQVVPSTQAKSDLVGRPIVHASAFKQATGEAIYCDDIPKYQTELYLAFVVSSKPHAKILSVDPSAALAMEGVRGWVDERDVPGQKNYVGGIIHDDVIFARDVVTCVGQPIGGVIAEDQLIAQRAAALVKVTYEELPAIFSIQEAIEHKSFFNLEPSVYGRGNVDEEFLKVDHILEGEVSVGGQEHFYLETNVSVAVPKLEDGCMEIFVSSQHPSEIQEMTAHALGVPSNRIVAKTKRLGGGFGGKELIFSAETMGHHVAQFLKLDYADFARSNLFVTGNLTHYNQVLEHCTLGRCFEQVHESGKYKERRKQCEEFNRVNVELTPQRVGNEYWSICSQDACSKLNERLKPYKEKNPTGKWQDWVKAAFFDRTSLAATGYFKTPDIGYDMKKNEGAIFNYFGYGASVSEVEIDCLTGDHQVRATEIVMDVGESLNPAIDVGQVEGAFMQGYGLYVMEELMFSPSGVLYTRGPGTYKIPGFADIPAEFNVSLLKGAPNPRAVYSSKAVGEPPLLLASSVYFAIRDAIDAYRKQELGREDYYRLDSPATPAKIRLLCEDSITKEFPAPEPGSYKPWNISIQ
ncbi:xanthine dehydrogenase [Diaphorina citri]|uniref:Xanthine dehydrogenase n=1 Tax=Diaphorina citri TaxID=121845 RepID=A0A3Q0ILS3_DIACI|nr:xanthine dehydrogenase [Diaphorina citri]